MYADGSPSPTLATGPSTTTTTTTTSRIRRNSEPHVPPGAVTNSRPNSSSGFRSGSLGSSLDGGDRTHIVGEGRRYGHPCEQCCVQ